MLTLRLKNYRRFLDETQVDFPPGLTIVTGPNGAGKTTLLEAVSYALFGSGTGRNAIRPRSDNAAGSVEVTCTLQVDDQKVKVVRAGSVAELWLDGTNQVAAGAGSVSQVNRQLEQLLGGLARDQFEKIYVAEQGETAGLVSDKPDKRQQVLEAALQMDVLRQACDLQEDERKRASTEVEALGRVAADTLGFTTEERQAIDEFGRARQARQKGEHLQRFLAQVERAVFAYDDAAQQATNAVTGAQAVEAEALRVCDDRQKQLDQLQIEEAGHEQRLQEFDAFRDQITVQATLRAAAEKAAETKEEEIGKAIACKDAAVRHNARTEQLTAINVRLARLPQVKDRWTAQEREWEAVSALGTRIHAFGDPESELADRVTKEAAAKHRWEAERDTDPTAEELAEWQNQQGALKFQCEQAEAATAALTHEGGEALCPTCNQRLTAHVRELRLAHLRAWLDGDLPRAQQALEGERRQIEQRRKEWGEAVGRAEEVWREASKASQAAQSRVTTYVALCSQLLQAKSRLAEAETSWVELGEPGPWDLQEQTTREDQAAELRAQIRILEADAALYAALHRLQRELELERDKERQASAQLERLRADQVATCYDKAAHDITKAGMTTAKLKLSDSVADVREAERQRGEHEKDAALKGQRARSAAEAWKRLSEATTGFRREARLAWLLSSFYSQFFTRNTEAIARRASQMIAQAATDGSILGVRFAPGGELHYLDASHVAQPVGRLSGGEKALVGLCLRIALAEQALRIARTGKLHFLILDEVLSALDDERREAIQRVLDDVQRQGIFEHIVMITHLDTVKEGWQGTRLEVEKVDAKTSHIHVAVAGSSDADAPGALIDEDLVEAADG